MAIMLGKHGTRTYKLERPAVLFRCQCGRSENVVFPRGQGKCVWICPACKRTYRADFNEHGGNIFLVT